MISYQINTDANLVLELLKRMEKRSPGLKVEFSTYNELKVSVIGNKIMMPSKDIFTENHMRSFKMLAWAHVFLTDKVERPVVHWLFWWFPFYFSCLSFLSVLAIWSNWFLLSLLSLVFVFYRRHHKYHLLARGYAAVIAVNVWRHGSLLESTKDWIVKELSGFRGMGKEEASQVVDDYTSLAKNVNTIRRENLLDYSVAFSDIYEILTDIDLEED